MKTILLILGIMISMNVYANSEVMTKSIQAACEYDNMERSKNKYKECFDSDEECLNSPLWSFSEKVTAYSLDGGFGYSCHYTIDKESGKVIKFQLTDPGE